MGGRAANGGITSQRDPGIKLGGRGKCVQPHLLNFELPLLYAVIAPRMAQHARAHRANDVETSSSGEFSLEGVR